MGSKGSSAQAPDPRLIEAQIRSMGVQDDAINSILQNSKDMAPLQKEQLALGLKSANTAYDQSQEDRAFAIGKRNQLSGLQDQMVNQAAAFNTDDKRNELAGRAMADVTQATGAAEDATNANLERMGVNPNSGRALAVNQSLGLAKAAMLANAGTQARTQARAEGLAMTDRASNALAGYPAMGMQATGSGAATGASGIGLANTSLAGLNSGASSAGGMASQLGGNAASMYGAMGSYKNGADAQANSTTNAVLGGLGSVIGGYVGRPRIGLG